MAIIITGAGMRSGRSSCLELMSGLVKGLGQAANYWRHECAVCATWHRAACTVGILGFPGPTVVA